MEVFLYEHDWDVKTVSYKQYGHTTREGWTHPSNVFGRPVSLETAYEFQFRFNKMKTFYTISENVDLFNRS